jgi:hypothetical protein
MPTMATDATLGLQTHSLAALQENTHQVVLLQERVYVLEEGDGGGAVDNPVHLSAQAPQLALSQPAVRRAEVALHNLQFGAHGVRHAAVDPHAAEERPSVQQVLKALLSCSSPRGDKRSSLSIAKHCSSLYEHSNSYGGQVHFFPCRQCWALSKGLVLEQAIRGGVAIAPGQGNAACTCMHEAFT